MKELLFLLCHSALTAEPKDKEFDASYLYVVWFGNDITIMDIQQIVQGLFIDWEGGAEYFKF